MWISDYAYYENRFTYNTFASSSDLSWQIQTAAKPDLAASSLAWNTKDGGADVAYKIVDQDLSKPGEVALYWSPSQSFDATTAIPATTYALTSATSIGTYSYHFSPSDFITPPSDAKYLILVVKPAPDTSESKGPSKIKFQVFVDPCQFSISVSRGLMV